MTCSSIGEFRSHRVGTSKSKRFIFYRSNVSATFLSLSWMSAEEKNFRSHICQNPRKVGTHPPPPPRLGPGRGGRDGCGPLPLCHMGLMFSAEQLSSRFYHPTISIRNPPRNVDPRSYPPPPCGEKRNITRMVSMQFRGIGFLIFVVFISFVKKEKNITFSFLIGFILASIYFKTLMK